jgi:hypothetical protein
MLQCIPTQHNNNDQKRNAHCPPQIYTITQCQLKNIYVCVCVCIYIYITALKYRFFSSTHSSIYRIDYMVDQEIRLKIFKKIENQSS